MLVPTVTIGKTLIRTGPAAGRRYRNVVGMLPTLLIDPDESVAILLPDRPYPVQV